MKIETPVRATRSYVQTLRAAPPDVFPLLCPVREAEWVEGWDPEVVYTESGLGELGCVFVTRHHGAPTTWLITRHDVDRHEVEMIRFTPGVTVCQLAIRLRPGAEGETLATVEYTHTAIGDAGVRVVEDFTEEHYASFMREWEGELNAFLAASP